MPSATRYTPQKGSILSVNTSFGPWMINLKESIVDYTDFSMSITSIYDLEINKEYRRRDLHTVFGGQQQGGISTPVNHNVVFLFSSDKSSHVYSFKDGWDSETGLYYYIGEGQTGDMTFQGGNKAIRDHLNNNKQLFLFKYVRSGIVKYLGEFICISHHFIPLPDRNNDERNAIVFELTTKSEFEQEMSETVDDIYSAQDYKLNFEHLRSKAIAKATSELVSHKRKQTYYRRSRDIKQYALRRAKGICEGCDQPAPFQTEKGYPFLEVHHIDRIADGGPDKIDAVAALCPNCHRRAHYGQNRLQFNSLLRKKIKEIENA